MDQIIFTLIGFFAGLVGTLAGSGGLIGMPSMVLLGVPVHSAIAAAKFSNIFSAFSSFIVLLKGGHITVATALKNAPVAIAGGFCGALLANAIPPKTMSFIAVILLTFALLLNIVRKPQEKAEHPEENKEIISPYIFSIAIYDGMFGPGQGTIAMHMYLQKGFTYIKAIAFTRFQTFLSCFGAIFPFISAGNVDWQVTIYFAAGSILGAQTALKLLPKIAVSKLKILLHAVTILLIVQLFVQTLR